MLKEMMAVVSFEVKVVEVEKLEGGEATDGGEDEGKCGGDWLSSASSSSSSKSENSSSEIGSLGSS